MNKYSRAVYIAGLVLVIAGIACFIIKACSGEYIDASGVLHEQFFLLPVGYLSIFIGILCFIASMLIRKHNGKK